MKKPECLRIDGFELWYWRTLESPLDSKEIQLVHLKGNQSWISSGRTDGEAETPILWSPDVKSWLVGKDPDAGRDWAKRRRRWQRMRWLGASLTRWMWVWVNSGSWWWTGRPSVLRFMGSQRVGHDWATELSWPERFLCRSVYFRGGTFAYIEDVYIAY